MEVLSSAFINDANLKAYWRLEDVNDSKNSYNLTNNNTVTFTTGKYSNGANLGSSNTNKSLSVDNDLGITSGAISISLWVKLLSEITTGTWFFADHSDLSTLVQSVIGYQYNSGSQRIFLDRTKRTVSNNRIYKDIVMGTTDFHHIVYVYDNTNLIGYYNGVQFDSLSTSGTGGGSGSIDQVNIGRGQQNDGSYAAYASALIDDVAIFNRALTAAEVKSIFIDAGGSFIFNMI